MACTAHQLCYSGHQIEKNEMGRACNMNGGEVYTGFWLGNLRERDHLEGLGVDDRVILKCIFKKLAVVPWVGLIRLRRGTGGGCYKAVK